MAQIRYFFIQIRYFLMKFVVNLKRFPFWPLWLVSGSTFDGSNNVMRLIMRLISWAHCGLTAI
jgi:hypothetical protein